ncbi:hypothetical protein ACQKQD_16030 [Methylobacterium sp. NPDC080182]|uniref:hypothetical protein n=1 Tax=Methylobacterium sp. NPDC080182 TaxID=3390590 RepID=UPI003D043A28
MFASKVEAAAIAWRQARMKACSAPVEGFVKDKKGDSIAVPNPSVWTDLGAAETALSEAVKAHLDEAAELAQLAARPKLFVIHGYRFHGRHSEEACTVEEAIQAARWAVEENTWRPVEIRTVAGELVLGGSAFQERIWADEVSA